MPPRSTENTAPASSPASTETKADSIALRRVAVLLSTLENNPEVRPDAVARGRALAADPNYPPLSVISKLSSLIVSGVNSRRA